MTVTEKKKDKSVKSKPTKAKTAKVKSADEKSKTTTQRTRGKQSKPVVNADEVKKSAVESYLDGLRASESVIEIPNAVIKSNKLNPIAYFPNFSRFNNLTELTCRNLGLNSLPEEGMPHLKTLNCSDNNLTVIPEHFKNLEKLMCENNKIKSLPSAMTNVTVLFCDNNALTSLPQKMFEIRELTCCDNKISSFDTTSRNSKLTGTSCQHLSNLFIRNNNFTNIPENLSSLVFFDCAKNNITTIPETLKNVKFMYCGHNKISALPSEMRKVITLECEHNKLTVLPDNMYEVNRLVCNNNSIRTLPGKYFMRKEDDEPSLYERDESGEEEEEVEDEPDDDEIDSAMRKMGKLMNLGTLLCHNNKLTFLPILPDGLNAINTTKNPLPNELLVNLENVQFKGLKRVKEMNVYSKKKEQHSFAIIERYMGERLKNRIQKKFRPEKLEYILATFGNDENPEHAQAIIDSNKWPSPPKGSK